MIPGLNIMSIYYVALKKTSGHLQLSLSVHKKRF